MFYRPRWPERALLHRLVLEHLETYLSLARQGHEEIDPVPGYVEGAFRRYLECGIPTYGFARARCHGCRELVWLVGKVEKTAGIM